MLVRSLSSSLRIEVLENRAPEVAEVATLAAGANVATFAGVDGNY